MGLSFRTCSTGSAFVESAKEQCARRDFRVFTACGCCRQPRASDATLGPLERRRARAKMARPGPKPCTATTGRQREPYVHVPWLRPYGSANLRPRPGRRASVCMSA